LFYFRAVPKNNRPERTIQSAIQIEHGENHFEFILKKTALSGEIKSGGRFGRNPQKIKIGWVN